MIIYRTPLRIGLFGGSTDLQDFIDYKGYGQVINFACNLYTTCILDEDRYGLNSYENKNVIMYKKREEESNISDIKNKLIRTCMQDLEQKKTIVLLSDITSKSSGLASSSSFISSIFASLLDLDNSSMSKVEFIKEVIKLEKQIVPLCGFQDSYGCIFGGLNSIRVTKDNKHTVENISCCFLKEELNMYLLKTPIISDSNDVLPTVYNSKNFAIREKMLDITLSAHTAMVNEDMNNFLELFKASWDLKKKTSSKIMCNELKEIEKELLKDKNILALKLCGSGGGGHFLILGNKDYVPQGQAKKFVKIDIDNEGVKKIL